MNKIMESSFKIEPYIRRTVYSISIIWSIALFWYVSYSIPTQSAALSSLMRHYGLTSLYLLFAVFMPGIISAYFPNFGLNTLLITSRRSIGVSVFFFGLLHATIGFFNNLSGSTQYILFLSRNHQLALIFSSIAFFIFTLMALTSFDYAVKVLGKKWKFLHRLAYIAAVLAVFHAFLIGSHFTNPRSFIPLSVIILAGIIILLEAGAIIKKLRKKQSIPSRKIFLYHSALSMIVIATIYLSVTAITKDAYDPHAQHRASYNQKYIVELSTSPIKVLPNDNVELKFIVSETASKSKVDKFNIVHEKLMHLILVSNNLTYYDHLHPDYKGDGAFVIKTKLPEEGMYKLYIEYAPEELRESLAVLDLKVGDNPAYKKAELKDDKTTKIFENRYKITISSNLPLKSSQDLILTYTIKDSKTYGPISDIEPYLAAFGHLTIISEDLDVYTHVHPVDVPKSSNGTGGPNIRFNTNFPKPGKYKMFAQFKHEGKIFVNDFAVDVQ